MINQFKIIHQSMTRRLSGGDGHTKKEYPWKACAVALCLSVASLLSGCVEVTERRAYSRYDAYDVPAPPPSVVEEHHYYHPAPSGYYVDPYTASEIRRQREREERAYRNQLNNAHNFFLMHNILKEQERENRHHRGHGGRHPRP